MEGMDLKYICRLCAKEDRFCIEVFGEDGMKNNISKKIRLCLPIVIREVDEYPKQICLSCLNKLDTSYELYSGCVNAQSTIKRMMISLNMTPSQPEKLPGELPLEQTNLLAQQLSSLSSRNPIVRAGSTVMTLMEERTVENPPRQSRMKVRQLHTESPKISEQRSTIANAGIEENETDKEEEDVDDYNDNADVDMGYDDQEDEHLQGSSTEHENLQMQQNIMVQQNMQTLQNVQPQQNMQELQNMQAQQNIQALQNVQPQQNMQVLQNVQSQQNLHVLAQENMQSQKNLHVNLHMQTVQQNVQLPQNLHVQAQQNMQSKKNLHVNLHMQAQQNAQSQQNMQLQHNMQAQHMPGRTYSSAKSKLATPGLSISKQSKSATSDNVPVNATDNAVPISQDSALAYASSRMSAIIEEALGHKSTQQQAPEGNAVKQQRMSLKRLLASSKESQLESNLNGKKKQVKKTQASESNTGVVAVKQRGINSVLNTHGKKSVQVISSPITAPQQQHFATDTGATRTQIVSTVAGTSPANQKSVSAYVNPASVHSKNCKCEACTKSQTPTLSSVYTTTANSDPLQPAGTGQMISISSQDIELDSGGPSILISSVTSIEASDNLGNFSSPNTDMSVVPTAVDNSISSFESVIGETTSAGTTVSTPAAMTTSSTTATTETDVTFVDYQQGRNVDSNLCKYCHKYFPADIIMHHRTLHFRERFFCCVACGKNFRTEIGLQSHRCEET